MVSTVKLGHGQFTYEVAVGWETPPPGYSWREVADVAVDSKDRVYVLNRGGEHPMIVFDNNGNFLRSWGEGVFSHRPHSVTPGPDDTMYCADDGDHTVRQFTLDGKVLMTIGVPGKPAERYSGPPFNGCTDVAIDPKTGDLYISDGYGNASIHKFSPDGKLLFSWAHRGQTRASSIYLTTSSRTKTATCTWPTEKATGYRYSTPMASSRRSGTTFTGPAASVSRRSSTFT